MMFPGARARAAVAVSGVLVVLGLAVIADQMQYRYEWARDAIDQVERRYARLLGIRDAAPALEAKLVEARGILARYAHADESSADRVGAELQQRVRALAAQANVAVVGSQILPVRPSDGFEFVPMTLTLESDVVSLRDFLVAAAAEEPILRIDQLIITKVRQRRDPTAGDRLRVQVNLGVIRLRS